MIFFLFFDQKRNETMEGAFQNNGDILGGMSEVEMAFFAYYKLPTYLKSSQKEIKSALLQKGLSPGRIREIVAENEFKASESHKNCIRCGSHKTFEVHVAERDKEAVRSCLICGFRSDETERKGFSLLKWVRSI